MVLAVLEVERRPVHLFVDNDAARWELQQRLDPLLRPRYETGKHADIWARVCEQVDQRAAGDVAVTWVKGHATQGHVDWGITTLEQLARNDRVDALATAAVEVHLTEEFLRRRSVAPRTA